MADRCRFTAATAEAAELLAASRCPVMAGLGTDIAGARAAIALAERIGAVVDHMNSDALLRDLEVMREAGAMMLTTPNEARLRADMLLLVGAGLVDAWPELPDRLFLQPPGAPTDARAARRIIWLCPGRRPDQACGLRERGGDRPQSARTCRFCSRRCVRASPDGPSARPRYRQRRSTRSLPICGPPASALPSGRRRSSTRWRSKCCAAWSRISTPTTRFSGLALAAARQCARRAAGLRLDDRLSHAHGFRARLSRTRPWRFDAARLVESGEADCVLWISAYRAVAARVGAAGADDRA